jgi:A/G-specific adenine glycosylase
MTAAVSGSMISTVHQPGLPRLRRALLTWYDAHRRELPWREHPDPYRVWVSEIMLQQTRVAAVLEHYARFMKRFPTVQSLACAREQSVLALWSGLGYYHRARRMQQAAKIIVRERGGVFPATSAEWLGLPGIGRYTAGAIASIAFGEPVAVVDGNVQRVLSRLLGSAMQNGAAWEQAGVLLDRKRPGDFNQAMMELGATVCTPRTPQCLLCPLSAWCRTRGEHPVAEQPARKRKQLCYALVQRRDAVLLVQRSGTVRLMASMWELPLIEKPEKSAAPIFTLRHSITDTDYTVCVFRMAECEAANSTWLVPKQWHKLALTGLARKILRKLASSPTESRVSARESKLSRTR